MPIHYYDVVHSVITGMTPPSTYFFEQIVYANNYEV
jgi:hypothetical protein